MSLTFNLTKDEIRVALEQSVREAARLYAQRTGSPAYHALYVVKTQCPGAHGLEKERAAAARIQRDAEFNNFKTRLFQDAGVENNPKRDKAFDLAWDECHAEGYTQVEEFFLELVELIK